MYSRDEAAQEEEAPSRPVRSLYTSGGWKGWDGSCGYCACSEGWYLSTRTNTIAACVSLD